MRISLGLVSFLVPVISYSQDTVFLKVHFLYGSKPAKKYRNSEQKWFGGKLGGHVGIEVDSDKIVNFIPQGTFHWFEDKKNKNSMFTFHSYENFYSMFGSDPDSVKKAIVCIPITQNQKMIFDSIAASYLKQTPYDYAFLGMRCAAAAYDILSQVQILKSYSHNKTYKKIFYPAKLRKRLFRLADEHHWTVVLKNGSAARIWDKDQPKYKKRSSQSSGN